MFRYIATSLFVLSWLSIFTWAFFDYTWWVDTTNGEFREFIIVVIHVYSAIVPAVVYIICKRF